MKMSNMLAATILATILPFAASGQIANASTSSVEAIAMTTGVVRKLDVDHQKITLKHEALDNLGMPAMTMVFRLGKLSLADKLTVGDRVMFRAEQINGNFVVTELTKQDVTR